MIEKTVEQIEAKIKGADAISGAKKSELLGLLSELKLEVANLSTSNADQAQSITSFTELSTHEATRKQQDPDLLKHSLSGLTSSVTGFEKSHPKLVQIVNAISNTLSNLGI